jgi:hypothetical protein
MRLLVVAGVAAGVLQAALAAEFLLDDVLLHMRAAELLLQTGFPTSDGVTRSFTDSSPAFLALTAAGLHFVDSIFVPKILSLVGYGMIVALATREVLSARQVMLQRLSLAYLLLIVSPFGVRWLTDGMETSLTVALVLLFADAAVRRAPGRVTLLAFLCVLFRVELVALAAVVALQELIRRRPRAAVGTLVGGAVAMLLIHLFFGSFWPDAAIAKARGVITVYWFVVLIASVVAGSGLFGVGLVLAWLGLTTAGLRRMWTEKRICRDEFADLLGALSLPAVLLAIFFRGQAVEGIRPLLPFLAFALVNATHLFGKLYAETTFLRRRTLAAYILVGAGFLFVLDWMAFNRMVRLQVHSLHAMRDKDWSQLSGHTGLAWDVGYLSYFSKARICDVQGLINGPAFARLTTVQRLKNCTEIADFAFVDQLRFQELQQVGNLRDWRICDHFSFAKRSEAFDVYLLVAPVLASEPFCPRDSAHVDLSKVADLSKVESPAK